MTRRVAIAAGLVVLASAIGRAEPQEFPRNAQPPQPKILPVQPILPKAAITQIRRLEEELELLEANRDVRRAHVRAADVGVEAAKLGVERLRRLVASGAITKEEHEKSLLEVKAAEAQLEIRLAEVKEVEVKIKYARQRLDDARGKGPAPAPAPAPEPKLKGDPAADPPADPAVRKAEAGVEVAKIQLQLAKAELQLATAERDRIKALVATGAAAQAELDAANVKVVKADANLEKAVSLSAKAQAELKKLKQ